MGGWIAVVRLKAVKKGALWPGEMLGITLGGVPVLLVNVDGHVRAYRDRCPHLGVRLSEGRFDGETLTCRAHQWQYDGRTGAGRRPIGVSLCALETSEENDAIYVEVRERDDG
jgi:toluene monooxygenase system ferredoxin subunit